MNWSYLLIEKLSIVHIELIKSIRTKFQKDG